jgi:predicted  nucleic acid-binding Zn-ribbon protein
MDENTTENAPEQPAPRERIWTRPWVRSVALVSGGLLAGGILAGTITANAADDGARPPYSQGEHGGHGPGDGDPSQPQRDDEELLTGETADQVTEVVLEEYPEATIERVETDSDGVYEAHIVTADDERLTVELDESFAITGTETHDGAGPGRGRGPTDDGGTTDEAEPTD